MIEHLTALEGDFWVKLRGAGLTYGADLSHDAEGRRVLSMLDYSTLVSQAHGAGDHEQIVIWLLRGLLIHAAVGVPVSAVLLMLSTMLRLIGQDAALASAAGQYCACLLPGLWAQNLTWVLVPWLQAQSVTRPQVVVSALAHRWSAWLRIRLHCLYCWHCHICYCTVVDLIRHGRQLLFLVLLFLHHRRQ